MTSYDVAIAYRIYPKVAKPAVGLPFSDNKLRLSEICLRSFKESLQGLRVKLWVLLDGCPESYAELFTKYFDPTDLVLIRLPGIGNLATFGKQIDILLGQSDSDLVYFAEDDYFYLPKQFHRMADFLRARGDVDFISPYDHLDCYTLEIHRRPKWLSVHGGNHWRTAASTCLTFLTRKQTLLRNEKTFRSYCRRNYDCSLWLTLTKSSIFSPFQILRFVLQRSLSAKIIAKAWLYGWSQILFGKRMKLWVPVPGIATHLDKQALSPNVDWAGLMNRQMERVEMEKPTDAESNDPASVRPERLVLEGGPAMEPKFDKGNRIVSGSDEPTTRGPVGACTSVPSHGRETSPTFPTLLSILVLTHNHGKFLEGCLSSIQEHVTCPFEVILVDNGSSETLPDSLILRFPWLRIIRSEKNLGFNAGNNLAARNANGEYLLLLNVDTVLLSDVVPAISLLQSDLKIGAVGAESHRASGELQPSAGRFPKAHRLWLFRSLWMKPKVAWGPNRLHAFKVDWVEGSFLVTTLKHWKAVGGFDEKNFLYGNDVEFCRSTSQCGLTVVQCTAVKYIHFGGYEASRVGQLYAAFRDYHKKFSTPAEQQMADLVLRAGLIARIAVYGFWYRVTRNKRSGEKCRRFAEVRRNWAQLTP